MAPPETSNGPLKPARGVAVACFNLARRLSRFALLYPPNYEPYQFDHLPRPIKFARDLVQRRKVATTLRRLAPEEATILDLGCGSGSFLRLLQEHGTKTWRLIGWDFPGPHIAAACRRWGRGDRRAD